MQPLRIRPPLPATLLAALLLAAPHARAQRTPAFGTCSPRSERVGRAVGCYTIVDRPIGVLGSAPVFWHVTRFPSRAAADGAARLTSDRSTVVDAFDGAWLLTIGDSAWRPAKGRHVAAIGPLPIEPGVAYSALYMEASMRPGMKSAIHRHSGPEAWYTLSGETCLETPTGTMVGRAGGPPVIVPGGPPMELTATGRTIRRSLVLILHDASKPPSTMESAWKPKGLCGR